MSRYMAISDLWLYELTPRTPHFKTNDNGLLFIAQDTLSDTDFTLNRNVSPVVAWDSPLEVLISSSEAKAVFQ